MWLNRKTGRDFYIKKEKKKRGRRGKIARTSEQGSMSMFFFPVGIDAIHSFEHLDEKVLSATPSVRPFTRLKPP